MYHQPTKTGREGRTDMKEFKKLTLTAPLPGDMLKQTDVDKLLDDDRHDRRQDLTLTITPKK